MKAAGLSAAKLVLDHCSFIKSTRKSLFQVELTPESFQFHQCQAYCSKYLIFKHLSLPQNYCKSYWPTDSIALDNASSFINPFSKPTQKTALEKLLLLAQTSLIVNENLSHSLLCERTFTSMVPNTWAVCNSDFINFLFSKSPEVLLQTRLPLEAEPPKVRTPVLCYADDCYEDY